MTIPSTPELILREIAHIQRMERGKLCPMRKGPQGAYYNHQTWENGRNVVRYVPRQKVPALLAAIAGYQHYLKLTQAYAQLIIAHTRQELQDDASHSPPPREKPTPRAGKRAPG